MKFCSIKGSLFHVASEIHDAACFKLHINNNESKFGKQSYEEEMKIVYCARCSAYNVGDTHHPVEAIHSMEWYLLARLPTSSIR